jgi:membrane protease YdiL (CAAX protease family)
MLDAVGFSQYFLLPVLTVSLLLGWHHLSHAPWRCSWQTVAAMWLEAGVFALVLRLLAILGSQFTLATWVQEAGEILSYLGAGIYEELLFRVLLLPAIAWGLIYGGRNKNRSWQFAIALSSLLFAAAHYQWSLPGWDFAGEPFAWPSFLFRTAAGVFFAILFLRRGFGIAAGTHALYDILVGLSGG